jgi:hypothetical protein
VPAESLGRRYAVATDRSLIDQLIWQSVRDRSFCELTLRDDHGAYFDVKVKVRSTDHDDSGSLFVGVTADQHAINIHVPDREEPFAIIAN